MLSCTGPDNSRLVCVACRPVRSNTFVMEIENQAARSALVQPPMRKAKFAIGQVVKHRIYPFRGVIFDVDAEFANSDEWYEAIPEDLRPAKDQPFYHLLAENAESSYIAYVSQQNLVPEEDAEEIDHPAIEGLFDRFDKGRYLLRREHRH